MIASFVRLLVGTDFTQFWKSFRVSDHEERSTAAAASFETYCDIVKSHKWRVGDDKRRCRKAHEAKKKAAVPPAS